MPKVCDHNIPETKKGAGPCQISFEVLKRNGRPNWWCHTHGMEASAPDGAALPACPGAWFEPVPEEERLTLDLESGEVAIWGAVAPALVFGDPVIEPGKVHVHHRPTGSGAKDIDNSYNIVTLVRGADEVVVEGMAAVAYSVSELAGQLVAPLMCPRCGQAHIDEQKFATQPHTKHLCNSCGRNFRDSSGPSISNPLANAYGLLGIEEPPRATPAVRHLKINRKDYSGIAIWPSNKAILSIMSRPEEIGLHVHAWVEGATQVLDETYGEVVLDGDVVDHVQLRWLAVYKALAHGAPIIAQACGTCGRSLLSPTEGWIEPRTTHGCACGGITRTRKRSFLNPLAAKLEP